MVHFSQATSADFAADVETPAELFYAAQITGFLAVTVDLQSITNPGGIAGQPDAWTGTTRMVINS